MFQALMTLVTATILQQGFQDEIRWDPAVQGDIVWETELVNSDVTVRGFSLPCVDTQTINGITHLDVEGLGECFEFGEGERITVNGYEEALTWINNRYLSTYEIIPLNENCNEAETYVTVIESPDWDVLPRLWIISNLVYEADGQMWISRRVGEYLMTDTQLVLRHTNLPGYSFPVQYVTQDTLAMRDDGMLFTGMGVAVINWNRHAANWNNDLVVDSSDFFSFIECYLSGNGDWNMDGGTNSADFFGFLTAFTGA